MTVTPAKWQGSLAWTPELVGNRHQNRAAEWECRHPEKRYPRSLEVHSCRLRPAGTALTDNAVVAVGSRESTHLCEKPGRFSVYKVQAF